jgi:hypothetical protein
MPIGHGPRPSRDAPAIFPLDANTGLPHLPAQPASERAMQAAYRDRQMTTNTPNTQPGAQAPVQSQQQAGGAQGQSLGQSQQQGQQQPGAQQQAGQAPRPRFTDWASI